MASETDKEPRTSSSTAPVWRNVIPKWVGIGLFLYASIFALSHAKTFLVPVVLAFLLAMGFAPIRRFLDRRGIPSGLSSLVIVLALLIGLLSLVGALAVPATGWIDNAPKIERQVRKNYTTSAVR